MEQSMRMIPYIDCMTTQMVADHFHVTSPTIDWRYQKNKEEFDKIGVMKVLPNEFESLFPQSASMTKKEKRGSVDYTFDNGMSVSIGWRSSLLFTKEAVEHMEQMLTNTTKRRCKQKELQITEKKTDEAATFRSGEERKLCLKLAKAFSTGDTLKLLSAALDLDAYRLRTIAEYAEENSLLRSESELMPWTNRASVKKIVRVMSDILEWKNDDVLNKIYYKMIHEYHIPLESRNIMPLVNAVKDSEWDILYRAVSDICEEKCLDIRKVFDKAKVSPSGLKIIM